MPLNAFATVLPAAALSEALRAALGGGGAVGLPLAILGAWALVTTGLAVRTFRWE